jgi:hypothetical protein
MLRLRCRAAAFVDEKSSSSCQTRRWVNSLTTTRVLRQQHRPGSQQQTTPPSRFSSQTTKGTAKDPLIGSSTARGGSTFASRWKGLPSFSEFHGTVVTKVQGAGAGGSAGGSAGWWWRRPIAYLLNNVGGIIAYEMFLETLVSGIFAGILLNKLYTIEELRAAIESSAYPFPNFFDWEGGVYTEGVKVPESLRPLVLKLGGTGKNSDGTNREDGVVMDAFLCTALHTSHNISMGFMPVTLVFLFATFPMARCVWPAVRGVVQRIPVIGFIFRPMGMPAEVLGAVNRTVGSSLGSTAMGGGGVGGGVAATASASVKQSSYAASSTKKAAPAWRK